MNDLSANQAYHYPPLIDVPQPRTSWLRVEIHFSSLLLFYGTIYGLIGLVMLFSGHFADLPPTEKLLMVLPFIIGPFVVSGIGWLQLLLLGWITRVLGDMA
jgi:hypothetical protein